MIFFAYPRLSVKLMLRKLLCLLGFCLVSCSSEQMSRLIPHEQTRAESIKIFWDWFRSEKQVFEVMADSSRPERLHMVIEHLAPIEDGLAVEISKEFHGVRDIIISADGDKEKFAVVEEIVKAAPKIPGWTTTAFRQRATEDFVLRHKGLRFSPREMYFRPIIENDSLDLIVYADSIAGKNHDSVGYYGLITMDNVLGEYASVMKVRGFDFRDLHEVKDKSGLRKLIELPAFVDDFYAKAHKK